MDTDSTSSDAARTLGAAGADRERRLAELFEAQRGRLARMLDLRMDPVLRARVAASDVLQDTWLEVRDRIDDWLRDPSMPFGVWVRFLATQRLLKARRFHLGAQRRDARRQVPDAPPLGLEVTSAGLVERLVAPGTSPSGVAAGAEAHRELHDAVESMDPIDREVLALRHFEELSNAEAAAVLGIHPDAASKRYLRALERLRRVLGPPGTGGSSGP